MLCTVRIRRIEGRTFNAKSDWVEFEIVGLSKPSRASDIRQSSPRNVTAQSFGSEAENNGGFPATFGYRPFGDSGADGEPSETRSAPELVCGLTMGPRRRDKR